MKRTLLIINPNSGTTPKDHLAERVISRLEPAGFDVECVMTSYAGHGFQLAAEAAAQGAYAVIAAGGDGTVNEIASALRGTETALGILPCGSGNGLARHLTQSIDIDNTLDIISKNNIVACDYGLMNDTPFFCTFGLGFDAKVSQTFAEMPTRGLSSYILSAIKEYRTFTPQYYEIETENHKVRVKAFVVAVCNASQYGNNAFIAPEASIRDGELDITVIHAGNPLSLALVGAELFTGRIHRNLLIETFRIKKATIRHLSGPGHIDGEPITTPSNLNIECIKGGIRLFTDPTKRVFRSFLTPMESIRDDSSFIVRENARIALKNIREALSRIFPNTLE